MNTPTVQTVREMLLSLIDGSGSRSTVEAWAWEIVCMQPPPEMPKNVWDAINALAGCEERDDGPGSRYIYGRADFEAWLVDLEAGV